MAERKKKSEVRIKEGQSCHLQSFGLPLPWEHLTHGFTTSFTSALPQTSSEEFTFERLQVLLVDPTELFLVVCVVGGLAVAVAVPVGLVGLHPCIVRQPGLFTVWLEPELVPGVTVGRVRHPDNHKFSSL